MKRVFKVLAGAVAVCVLAVAFQSCKKKKDETPAAKLAGKWKLSQVGIDSNNNNTVDPAEVISADSFKLFIAFGGDGSGTFTFNLFGNDLNSNFTWQLINNNADLKMTLDQPSTLLPFNSGNMHINNLSESDLVFRDTILDSTGDATWLVFSKLK